MKRPRQIIVSPNPEHIVNLAQDCYRTSPSGEPDGWLCRRLQESRVCISKTSDQIEGTSDAHAAYGTQLVLASNEMLEGCQSITSEHWQCDCRADWLWTPAEFEGSMGASSAISCGGLFVAEES